MARALLLVGCGKMGSALLRGWLNQGVEPARVTAVEPAADLRQAAAALGVATAADAAELAPGLAPEVVVFAVKPQVMDRVAPAYKAYAAVGATYLSIAAGKTIAGFQRHFGADAAIVRAMPNTPAAVGRGITVLCANPRVSEAALATCRTLMSAVGEVLTVADEALMDAVTAVSGSGPAYVFLLIECLARAGVEAGLDEEFALRLARATVSGAGELAHRSAEAPASLRRNVTSPGGTTEAALEVLMAEDGLQPLMTRAVAAAARRSRELAG